MLSLLLSIVIAYALGSVSSAVIISKVMGLPDPREEGSGNAGATNVLRVGGKAAGSYVMVADILKGVVAIILAHVVGASGIQIGFAALAVVMGHIFPVFFGFKGGKGVATMLGALLIMSFFTAIVLAIVWLVVAVLTRYASLASVVAAVAMPIMILVFGHGADFFPLLIVAAVVIWKHWGNIERLRAGTEPKINFGS